MRRRETDRQAAEKVGGGAALLAAATFVFGFVMFATVLSDYTTGDPTPSEAVAFLVDHQASLYAWNLVIFIVFGVVLVPLVLALHGRVGEGSPGLARMATAFGVIWAGLVLAAGMVGNVGLDTVADLHAGDPERAAATWTALDSVQNGLGGGNEIAGGAWVLLASAAALQAAALPRALAVLGMVAGVAGLVTVLPGLEPVGAVFGLGLIVWFAWVGVVLLSGRSSRATPATAPSPGDALDGWYDATAGDGRAPRAPGRGLRR